MFAHIKTNVALWSDTKIIVHGVPIILVPLPNKFHTSCAYYYLRNMILFGKIIIWNMESNVYVTSSVSTSWISRNAVISLSLYLSLYPYLDIINCGRCGIACIAFSPPARLTAKESWIYYLGGPIVLMNCGVITCDEGSMLLILQPII